MVGSPLKGREGRPFSLRRQVQIVVFLDQSVSEVLLYSSGLQRQQLPNSPAFSCLDLLVLFLTSNSKRVK